MRSRTRYGIGKYEAGKYKHYTDGTTCSMTKEYMLWGNVLRRCYSPLFHSKHPSYSDCEMSDNFLKFQYFAEWCNNQVGFGNEGWQLDKDILVTGSRLYSEDTCVFVPRRINNVFVFSKNPKDNSHIGVYPLVSGRGYVAKYSNNDKTINIGSYLTHQEAVAAYKCAKEAYVKSLAEEYKDLLDLRVYNRLQQWEMVNE